MANKNRNIGIHYFSCKGTQLRTEHVSHKNIATLNISWCSQKHDNNGDCIKLGSIHHFTTDHLCRATSLHVIISRKKHTMLTYVLIILAHMSAHGEVLWSAVVRRPSSCVVRRASCVVRVSSVNIWCLHSEDHICDTSIMKLDQNVCFDKI